MHNLASENIRSAGSGYNADEMLGANSATKTFGEIVIVSELLKTFCRWTSYDANLQWQQAQSTNNANFTQDWIWTERIKIVLT